MKLDIASTHGTDGMHFTQEHRMSQAPEPKEPTSQEAFHDALEKLIEFSEQNNGRIGMQYEGGFIPWLSEHELRELIGRPKKT